MFELFGIFEIFISVRIWRTPCKLLASNLWLAYPRLRIAALAEPNIPRNSWCWNLEVIAKWIKTLESKLTLGVLICLDRVSIKTLALDTGREPVSTLSKS
jgi:hypothetical protein